MTDCERELARLAGALAGDFDGAWGAAQRAGLLHRRALLSGDPADLDDAEAAIDDGLRAHGPWPDLCLLRATVDLSLHRLPRIVEALARAPGLAGSAAGRALLADVDLQRGRLDEASAAYEQLVAERGSWEELARLANLHAGRGDAESADALYAEAQDELTAKELRAYAWIELRRADLGDARRHVERAEAAFSGWWPVEQRLVRLLADEGRREEALDLAETLAARVPRPELRQLVGDVLVELGDPARARRWHDLALADYLASTERGDVHYLHHLAHFYVDVRPDPAEAERWARLDHELRPSPHARSSRGQTRV